LTALGAVILMFGVDPHLAWFVPALVPAFYLVLKIVGRRLRGLAESAQRAEAGVVATIERNLGMIPAIKSFAREAVETANYGRQVRRSMDYRIQVGMITAGLQPLVGLIAATAAVLFLYAAGQQVKSGAMTSIELFSFLFFAALLTRPVGALAHLYGEVQSARGTLRRLQSVLSESTETGYAGRVLLPKAGGEISFVDVSFSYPGREPLLLDVSLHISAGEKVALIGGNGAGKATLLNLLLRFIDPQQGAILVDGQDISSLNVQDLRRLIGVVPQQVALFNGTIRSNIAFGLDHASDQMVMEAATLAQAHEFISSFPAGYDTEIGDHGVLLSGGQRQRLSLARALLKNPPILILDEATSMYDCDVEQSFIASAANALKGRTVLFTTHRPATLALADRVLCVQNGSIGVASPLPEVSALGPSPNWRQS
jgi:ABC-type multidrug transport system fused ATPase/permease subunit